ncbi:NAD(P)H-binding protein [Actinoplanes couchii]|uniref:NmrA family transcriptional regulator n=2 Tax=Actinoplanes couchii TaxID=403638 RepID=A0ABQ3XRZ0_9ACTN|nr:NmrA family transcriptional regulator [Actinoplanes couchii]
MAKSSTLVLSSRGKTGRRVADRLEGLGHSVRAASRTGRTVFDLAAPDTWHHALEDVGAVYVVPMSGEEPADPAAVARFIEQAEKAGVRRAVLLSVRGAQGAVDAGQQETEEALRASGLEWTILRPAWFAQNFSEGIFLEEMRSGVLTTPAGDGSEAFIDLKDVADVAVAALTQPGHAGKIYELSGPEAMSFAQAVQMITAAGGPVVRYESVDPGAYVAAQLAAGVPAEVAEVVAELFGAIREGSGDYISHGVQQALGRGPRSFSTFAASAADAGVWAS